MNIRRLPSVRRKVSTLLATTLVCSSAGVMAAPPAATGTGWDLVFADEFGGTGVDTLKWNIASPSWTMPNSLSAAAANQVSAANGALTLNATRTANAGATQFSSGSVSTYNKYTWTSGYFEARILLPTTPGSWPAFWGLYTGWPPEADIMEYPLTTDGGTNGYANTKYHTAFHYTNSGGAAAAGAGAVDPSSAGALNGGYHTFGMHWVDDTSVTFYFDGVQVSSFANSAVAQMANMYLILDYAVGGWPGTPSTTQWPVGASDQTLVDYVRVWQQRPTGSSTTSTWKTNGDGTWTTSGNWTGIVPKHSGQQAVFPTVGTAATAAVDWTNSQTVGGITFSGGTTTTAYTLIGDSLQLAGSSGTANAYVEALATSQANQTINSRVELYNTTEFRNNMAAGLLILNGLLIGDGGLVINGPGTVQFSNNNTYTGDTSIGSGQGAAVARVTRSRPFGTTGVVNIGPAGNGTTARIEIQDSRDVPNTINLSGRNNASVAIENLAANNSFSGTINAQVGGSQYLIQSDAGQLTLSGAATGANGVALRAGTTGARTFTLQGAGSGVVSGVIENGSGTVSITKAGAGTWTLGGANTYTGTTTLSAGTLVINGTIASGGTFSAASGTTLTGTGTINASATINGTHQPGSGVGAQILGTVNYGSTARLAWELGSNSATAGAFDKVTATGPVTVTSGAALDVSLTATGGTVALNNAFWTQAQSWMLLTAPSISGSFTLGNVSADSGGRVISNYGTLALQQSATAVTLTFTPYTAQQNWQRANFGANWSNNAIAGDTVDLDKDGLPNLLEYVLASDPNASTPAAAPQVASAGGKLSISFTRNTAATDVTLSVVGSDSPGGPWMELARSTAGGAFVIVANGATVSETGSGATRSVQVGDLYATGDPAHPTRFLRLRVDH